MVLPGDVVPLERASRWVRRALGLCVLLLVPVASATTLLRADVPTLAKSADSIVRGRVTQQTSHWTGDKLRIVTDVQITVEEVLKGSPGKVVTVRQLGGRVGDIGQQVSGIASFQPGEEVVVFLEHAGPVARLAGMAQGKFHLERTAQGALQATPESTGDAEVIDRTTRAPVTRARTPVAYPQLKQQIAQALGPKAR